MFNPFNFFKIAAVAFIRTLFKHLGVKKSNFLSSEESDLILDARVKLVQNGDRIFAFQFHPVVEIAVGSRVASLGNRPEVVKVHALS